MALTTTAEGWRVSEEQRAMVEANRGLVHHHVKQRYGAGCPQFDDLAQVGMLGLMRAAIRYDPTRGLKFSTYAVATIRRTINRHLIEDGLIHVPSSSLTSPELVPFAARARRVASLDDRLPGGQRGFEPAAEAGEDVGAAIDLGDAKARLAGWLEVLSARDREVIALRFGLRGDPPRTLKQVGEWFGITKERVRQIEGKALAKLRELAGAA